jgi:hypothetical protein
MRHHIGWKGGLSWRKAMKRSARAALACFALCSTAGICLPTQSAVLHPNQTEGFGANKRLLFTYTQNFDCVDQPGDDQDFDRKKAQTDPDEMQIPICQAGIENTVNPKGKTGKAGDTTDHLYVLVPMFSVDNDQNPDDAISCQADTLPGTLCGPALGAALIKLFGAVPEGFKDKPLVFTQCPDNGGRPGTCTMHATRVDLAPLLAQLGLIGKPPTANVFVPTPNHSHVLDDDDIRLMAEWWQVRPILVMDKRDWPPQDGSSGITSSEKMDAAEKAGRAIEAPSNFFLFFSSHVMH